MGMIDDVQDGFLLPKPAQPIIAESVRRKRNNLLITEIDVINAVRWHSMSVPEQNAWSIYRQELLDVPQQIDFPDNISWPIKPI